MALGLAKVASPSVFVVPTMKAYFPGMRALKEAQMPDGKHDLGDSAAFGAGFMRPRYTPAYWVSLVDLNTRLKRCIDSAARSAVGLGIEARPHEDYAEDYNERRNTRMAIERDMRALTKLSRRPNPDSFDPLTEVYYRLEWDWHASGNSYEEVVEEDREAGRPIVNIGHVPCSTVRVNRDRTKYVRTLSNGHKVYFRRFGDEDPKRRYMDKVTGQFFERWPADMPLSRRATAIIHHKQYCPFDDYYGQPTVAPAINAVLGNYLAEVWGVNLLKNNAHIPVAIVVENGNLDASSMEHIEAFMSKEASGIQNAGKIMVLQPDMSRMSIDGGLKLRFEKLEVGVKDDALFKGFKSDNNDTIQETFGISDVYLGGGKDSDTSTRNAATLRQITQEHVIDPRTDYHETVFNEHIAPRLAGGKAVLRFKRASNLDALQQASVIQKLQDGLQVDDLRELAGTILQRTIKPIGGKLGQTLVLVASKPPTQPPAFSQNEKEDEDSDFGEENDSRRRRAA